MAQPGLSRREAYKQNAIWGGGVDGYNRGETPATRKKLGGIAERTLPPDLRHRAGPVSSFHRGWFFQERDLALGLHHAGLG
jgi:hypothetical protein